MQSVTGAQKSAWAGRFSSAEQWSCRLGQMDSHDDVNMLMLTENDLDVAALSEWVITPDSGAGVVFFGTARDHSPAGVDEHGAPTAPITGVTELIYEAYEEAAMKWMRQIVAAMRERHPDIRKVAIAHRTGTVAVGEKAVVVAVSAPHRGEAFGAASFGIEELKRTLPVWKKEVWPTGSEWSRLGTASGPVSAANPVETEQLGNLHVMSTGTQNLGGDPGT